MTDVRQQAAGLVVLLGWDWWDYLQALPKETDDTLRAVIEILEAPLKPGEPDDDRYHLGIRLARRQLYLRHGWTTTYWVQA